MMNFTTADKLIRKRPEIKLWAVVIWLAIWQIGSMLMGQEILLVSPVVVVIRLAELIQEIAFWETVMTSLFRIMSGFFLAMLAGVILAALASKIHFIRDLLAPITLAIKSIPVASFIILALIWIASEHLAITISFLMVFPIIYANMLQGIECTDKQLLEMAKVFRITPTKTIRSIYVPQVLPYFKAACSISLGLSWKSGIAAEVIGIPKGSIGESLYNAKIYLDTPDLFAWTVTIVVVSLICEKVIMFILSKITKIAERV